VTWMGFALGDAARRIEGLSEFELRWPIDWDLVILEFLGSPSHPPREHGRKSFLSDNVGFHGLSPHHDDNVSVCVLIVLAASDTALTFWWEVGTGWYRFCKKIMSLVYAENSDEIECALHVFLHVKRNARYLDSRSYVCMRVYVQYKSTRIS
jgi:hypothetical protein